MTEAAPRITAGYDADEPVEHRFPRVDRGAPNAAPRLDPGQLGERLSAALASCCRVPVRVQPAPADAQPLAVWCSPAGDRFAAAGGLRLASALLSRQCGGGFVADAGPATRHVERCRCDLLTALRDALLPGALDWQPADPDAGPGHGFTVDAGGVEDTLILLVEPAVVATDDGDWARRLRGALAGLAVPVRLVLHEGAIAVRAARALAVGDVLPIATAAEVGLRVGTLGLARGRVCDSDGAVPSVRITSALRVTS